MILIYGAIATLKKGNKQSRYYLFAITVYLSTIVLMSSMASGWLDYSDINRYAFLFGSGFEIIFFSLMLVNRFNKIQKKLIILKEKNEIFLAREVKERTEELREMNIELQVNLKNNETLLRELQHRIKNNFQMLISIFWIESNKVKNRKFKENFIFLINRIKSMSIIHDFLYNAKNISEIKADEYILKIVEQIRRMYIDKNIKISTNLDSTIIDIDKAMILGMIINEVLVNSIKHHTSKTTCEININFNILETKSVLIIQDNGDGFDNSKDSSSLGMGLIEEFVQKLDNSEFSFKSDKGTRFELSFSN